MTSQVTHISNWRLIFGIVFILTAGMLSLLHALRLGNDLQWT